MCCLQKIYHQQETHVQKIILHSLYPADFIIFQFFHSATSKPEQNKSAEEGTAIHERQHESGLS